MMFKAIVFAIVASLFVSEANAQAVTNGRATSTAPSYTNNSNVPLSLDLDGNLRTSGSINLTELPPGTNSIGTVGLDAGVNSVGTVGLDAGTNNIGDVDVLTLPPIPAGTNNIGDVDVLTLPSIPAGTNNIGDVDVVTLPSIPAGTNNIGDVDVVTLPPIPAGTNNIGDVDVLSLPSLPAGANNIGQVEITGSLPAGSNNIGSVSIGSTSLSTNYADSTVSTSATVICGTACNLVAISLNNASAAGIRAAFYDNASACSGTVRYGAWISNSGINSLVLAFPNVIEFTNGITVCTNTGTVNLGTTYE